MLQLVRGSEHHSAYYIIQWLQPLVLQSMRPRRNLAMTCVTPPARDYVILYPASANTHSIQNNVCASGFWEQSLKANSLRNATYYIIMCVYYMYSIEPGRIPLCIWHTSHRANPALHATMVARGFLHYVHKFSTR